VHDGRPAGGDRRGTGEVARRFSVAPGREGGGRGAHPLRRPAHDDGHAHPHAHAAAHTAGQAAAARALLADLGAAEPGRACSSTLHATGTHEVLEIDSREWTLTRRFATGENPYNVEVTPDGRLLLVTLRNRPSSATEIFDLRRAAHRWRACPELDHAAARHRGHRRQPLRLRFRGGRGAEPGKVDVIDLRTFERVASVEVGQQAAGIAIARD
jgi:hypothetical protein